MAPASPLAQLLESQQDLATSILSLLALGSLAALDCTSRSMHAVVAAQTESLWQARPESCVQSLCSLSFADSCMVSRQLLRKSSEPFIPYTAANVCAHTCAASMPCSAQS